VSLVRHQFNLDGVLSTGSVFALQADNLVMDAKSARTSFSSAPGNGGETFWQQLTDQNKHSRRSYPRIHADIRVQVLGVEAQPIELRSRDISFGGLQIRCDLQTCRRVLRLDPQAVVTQARHHANPVDDIAHIQLQINLLVNDRIHKILCLTRVIHYVLIAGAPPGEEIAIGFRFLGFKEQGKRVLHRFVEENMIPAGY